MIFNAILVIIGNIWYELIVFGNLVVGPFTNIDSSLATSNFFIDTYTNLTGLNFPYMYSLSSLPLPSMTIGVNSNIFEYYSNLINYSVYGIVALVLEVALSLGVFYFALKFASKVSRMIKDLLNPLN